MDLLLLARDIAQVLFPALPIDKGVEVVLEILKVYPAGGVVELTEEELDAFQRAQLTGGGS